MRPAGDIPERQSSLESIIQLYDDHVCKESIALEKRKQRRREEEQRRREEEEKDEEQANTRLSSLQDALKSFRVEEQAKIDQVKAKEDRLKAKEDRIKANDDRLKAKEDRLKAKEFDLKLKEDKLADTKAALQAQKQAAEAFLQAFGPGRAESSKHRCSSQEPIPIKRHAAGPSRDKSNAAALLGPSASTGITTPAAAAHTTHSNEDDDGGNLFGSDTEDEDAEAERISAARVAGNNKKMAEKEAVKGSHQLHRHHDTNAGDDDIGDDTTLIDDEDSSYIDESLVKRSRDLTQGASLLDDGFDIVNADSEDEDNIVRHRRIRKGTTTSVINLIVDEDTQMDTNAAESEKEERDDGKHKDFWVAAMYTINESNIIGDKVNLPNINAATADRLFDSIGADASVEFTNEDDESDEDAIDIGEDRDGISGHYKPQCRLTSHKAAFQAACSVVKKRNLVTHSRYGSVGSTARKNLLSTPIEQLGVLLMPLLKRAGVLVLDAIISGKFDQVFTKKNLEAIKDEDPLDCQDGIIYMYVSFDQDGKPGFIYIGQASTGSNRIVNHEMSIDGLVDIHGLPCKPAKGQFYDLAREARSKGHSIIRCTLASVKRSIALWKEILLVLEPVFSLMLGSFQGDKNLLKMRARVGFPIVSFMGANSTQCFESSTSKETISHKHPKMIAAHQKIQLMQMLIIANVVVAKSTRTTSEAKEQAVQKLPMLKARFDLALQEFRRVTTELLYEGTFVLRMKPYALGGTFYTTNFPPSSVRGEIMDKIFKKESLAAAKRDDTPLYATLQLVVTNEPSAIDDVFVHLTMKDSCLLGGVRIRIVGDNGTSSFWSTTQPVDHFQYNRKKTFDFIFNCLPEADRADRRRRAEAIPVLDVPAGTDDMVALILKGELPGMPVNVEKQYYFNYLLNGKSHKQVALPASPNHEAMIKSGIKSVCVGVDMDSDRPVFPTPVVEGESEWRAVHRQMALVVWSMGGEWVPAEKTYYNRGDFMFNFLKEVAKVYISMGKPNLLPMIYRAKSTRPKEPPADEKDEPDLFKRKSLTLNLSSQGQWSVATPGAGSFVLPSDLLKQWCLPESTKTIKIEYKIDARRAVDASRVKLWVCLRSNIGPNSGKWYLRHEHMHGGKKEAPPLLWQAIRKAQAADARRR